MGVIELRNVVSSSRFLFLWQIIVIRKDYDARNVLEFVVVLVSPTILRRIKEFRISFSHDQSADDAAVHFKSIVVASHNSNNNKFSCVTLIT